MFGAPMNGKSSGFSDHCTISSECYEYPANDMALSDIASAIIDQLTRIATRRAATFWETIEPNE